MNSYTIHLAEEMHSRVKNHARKLGVTMGEVIEKLIYAELKALRGTDDCPHCHNVVALASWVDDRVTKCFSCAKKIKTKTRENGKLKCERA